VRVITFKVNEELLRELDLFAANNRLYRSELTSSPPWKGRGFPPKGLIVPTIDSGLHLSSGEQSSGSENHSHLKGGLSSLSSSPLKEKEDDGCSSLSPIKPSIELGRSVISITKRNFGKEVFKYKGATHPLARLSAPLTPFFVIRAAIEFYLSNYKSIEEKYSGRTVTEEV